jgi:hypothetical protein
VEKTATICAGGGAPLDPVGLSDHHAKTRSTEMVQSLGWRNTEFSLSQRLYNGEAIENARFLGL